MTENPVTLNALRKRVAKLEAEKTLLEGELAVTRGQMEKITQNYEIEIANRIRLENDHRRVAEKYSLLISQIPGVVFSSVYEAAWTMEFISDRIEELSGYPATDFVHNKIRTFASIIYRDDIMPVTVNVKKALDQKRRYRIEYRVMHRDGSIRYVVEVGAGSYGIDGSLLRNNGVIFDVTERTLNEMRNRELDGAASTL